MVDISFSIDPVTSAILVVGLPIAYGIWRTMSARIDTIENFLISKFGKKDVPFTPYEDRDHE